jgi:hypothetical protein
MLLRCWIGGIGIIREPNNIGAVQSMFRRLHPGDVSWRPELGVFVPRDGGRVRCQPSLTWCQVLDKVWAAY